MTFPDFADQPFLDLPSDPKAVLPEYLHELYDLGWKTFEFKFNHKKPLYQVKATQKYGAWSNIKIEARDEDDLREAVERYVQLRKETDNDRR